jgi:hypothetical protein
MRAASAKQTPVGQGFRHVSCRRMAPTAISHIESELHNIVGSHQIRTTLGAHQAT